jgi:hypothetical protein
MKRLCCLSSVVLAAATLALVYLFVVRGQTLPASDGRTAILLAPGERDMVLAEMRGFLTAVQGVGQAIVDEDAKAAVLAAREAGAAAQQGAPPSLVGKLPVEFKRLGIDTHQRFDQLAMNIETFEETGQALPELVELMNNCTACHAAYRFELEQQ